MPVKIIASVTEFEQLREKWNALVDTSVYPNIFTTWEWSFLWWKHFGASVGRRDGTLFILLVENEAPDDELLGIFPFYRTGNGRLLYWIGYGARPCAEYLGPIIRHDAIEVAVQTVCDFLANDAGNWNRLFFEDYALDDPGTMAFADCLKGIFPSQTKLGEPRYFIALPDSYEAYLDTLSAGNRKYKKHRLNKSKSKYHATTEIIPVAEWEHGFSLLVELTTQARQRKGQSSPFMQTSYRDFHREVIQTLLPLNRAILFLLKYSDKPAGILYGYSLHQKCYDYQTGFATDCPGSPGDLVFQYLLMSLIDRQYSEFDFLRGTENFKSSYTKTTRETETLSVYKGNNFTYFRDRLTARLYYPLKQTIKHLLMKLTSIRLHKKGDH